MNGQTPTLHAYERDFAQRFDALPGAQLDWLCQQRRAALQAFLNKGFPATADEDWRYCDLSALGAQFFAAVAAPQSTPAVASIVAPIAPGAARLTFVNGRYQPALSTPTATPGIEAMPVDAALTTHGEWLASHWARPDPTAFNGPCALNAALWQDGAVVSVAPVDSPAELSVELLFLWTLPGGQGAQVRNLVVVGSQSRITLSERHIALDGSAGFANIVTDIVLEPDARMIHIRAQLDAGGDLHLNHTRVVQHRASGYRLHQWLRGGRLRRHALHVALRGEGAECTLQGLALTGAREQLSTQVLIDHLEPRATSRVMCKGIVADNARNAFRGRIVVHPAAQKSDAQLTNHNLLLAPTAEADSQPQLEIHADDVKCAHGASVGRLDEEALYYLRCRALDAQSARGLLIQAFAADVLEGVPWPTLRETLRHWIEQRSMQ